MLRRLVVVACLVAACDRFEATTAPSGPTPDAAALRVTGAAPAESPVVAAVTSTFEFLPPLGTGVEDPSTFDATAAPTVEVCAWNGTACTAPPVVTFSTTPSGSTLPITIDAVAGRYVASWNLLDARFTTRLTYRIRVLQGATELGAVSVDVVRGRWALTRSDGTLAPLLAASELPIAFTIASVSAGPGPLRNGATATGRIALAHQVDTWTFTANAGDHVVLSLGETGTTLNFSPWLRVNAPGGTLVASNFGFFAAQVEFTATTTGTYSVLVASADGGGVGTGDYLLTLIKAPGALVVSPGDQGGTLGNGTTHTGNIYLGDIDGWTFSANVGDHVVVSVGETANSSGFSPWLRIVAPNGTVVGSNFGFVAAQIEFAATVAGTYTVIVGSAAGGFTGTGDYLITSVRAPGIVTASSGDEGGPLVNGATATGAIYSGDIDGWTLTANQSEHVVVSLGETTNSSGFSPWLRVLAPDGSVVASNFGFSAAQVEFSAPMSGTYTVVVASAGGGFTGTGDYLLTYIKAPGALTVSTGDEGGALTNGATHTGTIYLGDVDGWTFAANAGDRVVVSLGETTNSSGFSPWLRVVGPTGAVIGSNFGFSAAQVEFAAPTTGTYTVIVGSAGGGFTGTGDYLLSYIKAPGAVTVSTGDQGGALVNGATHAGTIYLGDIDGWTFSAAANDHVVVSLGETTNSSGFSPWLRVVAPNGTVVGNNFGFSAAQVEFSAPVAGTYTVIVASAGGGFTGTGDYLLTLAKAPGAVAVSASDEGGPMTNGATHTGTIYLGDVDVWTFTATMGNRVVVSLGETTNSSGFSPWLRIVGPDGAPVGSNFGFSAAQLEFNAALTGTYTVIVGSAGGGFTGTGDYLLTLIRAPGTLTVSAGDQGGALASGVTSTGTIYTGDVDGWTFAANAGDPIALDLAETGVTSGFSPWLRVIGPNGNVVASNFGFAAAHVAFVAATTGTYTVIVASAGGGFTGTGDYNLLLTGSTASFRAAAPAGGGESGGRLGCARGVQACAAAIRSP
ncbi:peptidase domain protein [Gemmatirosa kalamazoonensis]|uniref:Peptidase domain protein n=1 Tax=Gemmatirosa kalamazoonensis TaxID=861299 RepID=W0RIM3_9BACT|nr:PPC domain-containing protein [Gemmatirosa kalamazoonensis]AHG90636.1 peptidase domain protein [Gemmatirosa kalamazoonensis]